MLTAPLLLAAALAPADAPTPPPDAAVSDAGELQGEWEVVGCVIDGKDQSASFRGDRWAFAGPSAYLCASPARQRPLEAIRADAAADPPRADLSTVDGADRRTIYRRFGDVLTWVWAGRGASRPTSFEPAPSVIVWTLRRVEK